MPLYGEQEVVGRIFEGFDDPVFGIAGCHDQPRSQLIDGLMVARVHLNFGGAEDGGKAGMRLQLDGMYGLRRRRVPAAMTAGLREVLDEGPAAMNVQQLQTTANGEDRDVGLLGSREQASFEVVALGIDVVERWIGRLAVLSRIDVAAAGEDKTLRRGYGITGFHRKGIDTGGFERGEVGGEFLRAASGDENFRAGHEWPGPPNPIFSSVCYPE